MDNFLQISNLNFDIDGKRILSDINLTLAQSSIVALLGPSGCGKTSLLRLIAGFVPPTTGDIFIADEKVSSPAYLRPPEKRGLGMVFQDYALFPHLSVFDNVAFGLAHIDNVDKRKRVSDLLDLVDLSGYEKRFPHELSGGEQQRISIIRAIAPRPKLLLMDEPFASLDTNLRERLVGDFDALLKGLGIAAILVTHDQREAFAVSEQIALMKDGRILQWDKPYNIYHEPSEPFVADFVGQGTMIKATVVTSHAVDSALGIVESLKPLPFSVGRSLCMLVRPDDIVEDKDSANTAKVVRKSFHGASTLYELDYRGIKLVANLNSHADYIIGDMLHFAVKANHLVIFDHGAAGCVC